MGHAFRSARSEETKRLLVLQAAAWLPAIRDHLVRRRGLSMDGPSLRPAAPPTGAELPTLDEAVERRAPAEVLARLTDDAASLRPFRASLRRSLFREARDHHQYKYAAAIHEESRLASPIWAPRILAPAVAYLPTTTRSSDVHARSLEALARAGLG